MEENKFFQEQQKKLDLPALVLGIVALLISPFSPLVSYICGIIGLVFAIRHRKEKRTIPALIICIVGLVCGVASHVYTILVLMKVI